MSLKKVVIVVTDSEIVEGDLFESTIQELKGKLLTVTMNPSDNRVPLKHNKEIFSKYLKADSGKGSTVNVPALFDYEYKIIMEK